MIHGTGFGYWFVWQLAHVKWGQERERAAPGLTRSWACLLGGRVKLLIVC